MNKQINSIQLSTQQYIRTSIYSCISWCKHEMKAQRSPGTAGLSNHTRILWYLRVTQSGRRIVRFQIKIFQNLM